MRPLDTSVCFLLLIEDIISILARNIALMSSARESLHLLTMTILVGHMSCPIALAWLRVELENANELTVLHTREHV